MCVVPARLASSRFPGKPLVLIDGLPMVVRSARRALEAGCFEQVVVATEDPEIVEVCTSHGLDVLLTPAFSTGTDRVAWVAAQLGCAWVVNLQGDEPVFPLSLLRELCGRIPTDPAALWTAADLRLPAADLDDRDVVKILLGPEGHGEASALDFHRDGAQALSGRGVAAVHVGVYAGSAQAFARFAGLPPTPRELERGIEPLRALDAGMPVKAVVGKWMRVAVDRMEHISRVLDHLHSRGESDANR